MLAHLVEGGAGPAPPWLLSYIGAFLMVVVAVWLRATWLKPRLEGVLPSADDPTAAPRPVRITPLNAVGILLLGGALAAAIIGPDSAAANVAPVAVLVVWWVGLPILCLVLGDVMRWINPFTPLAPDRDREPGAPAWTSAAFLFAFAWFFLAYHRPGSPRSLAVFLVVYIGAAIAGGFVWGRRWLATGEGFGGLSAALATISPWRRQAVPPPGLAALMCVWLGSSLFDGFASTPFWGDVLGTSLGWDRTLLNTVGLVWMVAIVAGAYLLVTRLATEPLATPLAVALVPLAAGWFVAHDLTLLLAEGQNFIALISDPIGRGWDLFGTIHNTIDFEIAQAGWVVWVQLVALGAGHAATVVVGHDTALRLVSARQAMRVTWGLAAAAIAAIVSAVLLILG